MDHCPPEGYFGVNRIGEHWVEVVRIREPHPKHPAGVHYDNAATAPRPGLVGGVVPPSNLVAAYPTIEEAEAHAQQYTAEVEHLIQHADNLALVTTMEESVRRFESKLESAKRLLEDARITYAKARAALESSASKHVASTISVCPKCKYPLVHERCYRTRCGG